MRERKSVSARRPAAASGRKTPGRPKHDYSKELMELVVEAANSRVLPEFLRGFAERTAEMLDAEWAGVGEIVGSRVEIYTRRPEYPANKKEREGRAQGRQQKRPGLEVFPLKRTGQHIAFYPIYASDGELMGTLCMVRKAAGFSRAEEKLLAALASHAALSMEKVRRFSQLERSKKQWVEDIDAISDYIAVHDQAWKIVRTNRSLATELGIPPAALVGEPISSLRHIAETGSALPCPFCRDTREAREEYIATSAGRTFLVSTSRTRGANEEESRTIHVLKDITDRREAERRYRELFDSIQEGLFFATPDGRFLDVNDAMVRMLGYDARDELLRADVGPHLYPAPAARERFLLALSARGVLRNYEETLRRKDGTLLHTLQNITAVRDAQGRIAQIRGLMLDVTEQKSFQSQLQRDRKSVV